MGAPRGKSRARTAWGQEEEGRGGQMGVSRGEDHGQVWPRAVDEGVQVSLCRQPVSAGLWEAITQHQTISHCVSRPPEVRL